MKEQLRTAAALINFAVNSTVYLRTGRGMDGSFNIYIDAVRLHSQVHIDRQIKLDYSYKGDRHIATGTLRRGESDTLQIHLPLSDVERLHEIYGAQIREIIGQDFIFAKTPDTDITLVIAAR